MTVIGTKSRYVTHLIPARTEDILHEIEIAKCDCSKEQMAPAEGVPKSGDFDTRINYIIATLRAGRMTIKNIPATIKEILGLHVSVGSVNNIIARVTDACEPFMEIIHQNIMKSPSVHVDETGISLAGRRGWAWQMLSGQQMMLTYDRSRSSGVVD